MYTRVNIIFGEKSRVDAGIDHIEGADRGLVEAATGNRGLTTLVDRQAGVIVAVSYWDKPLHSSEAALTQAREDAAAAAGGDLVVERYGLAVSERLSVPAAGAAARMARINIEPNKTSDALNFVRAELLPPLRLVPGFCSAELLLDHSTGIGILLTAWDDEQGGKRSERVLEELNDDALERAGTRFPRTESYVVVRAAAPTD